MKFEYKSILFEPKGVINVKIDTSDLDAVLNKFGVEGWELVNSLPSVGAYGSILCIFKRAIN